MVSVCCHQKLPCILCLSVSDGLKACLLVMVMLRRKVVEIKIHVAHRHLPVCACLHVLVAFCTSWVW